jgi:uncharacterized protein YndB with AHSA1/START domain
MAEEPSLDNLPEPGISITRVFDAPRERVWKEWTEPERFADWYGGHDADIPLSTVSMDVRPGGRFRFTMFFGPNRFQIDWKGEYVVVVEPERLVFKISDQPTDDVFELVSVFLTDLGDGTTELLLEQRGQMTAEQYKAAGGGWSRFLDVIEERLRG